MSGTCIERDECALRADALIVHAATRPASSSDLGARPFPLDSLPLAHALATVHKAPLTAFDRLPNASGRLAPGAPPA
jgi:hypothetical protein